MIAGANHEPAAFIRVSQDTIININEIKEINKYYCTCDFDEWLNTYKGSMEQKINKYFNDTGTDKSKMKENELNELMDKLNKKYDKEIRDKIGPKPELYVYSYYVVFMNNATMQISKRGFLNICKKYGIDPNKTVKESPYNSAGGDMSVDDYNAEEIYNSL